MYIDNIQELLMASEAEKPDIDFRVKLRNSTVVTESVTFEVTPDLIETRNVNYRSIDPIHAPGQILAYQNTNSRNFNISQVRLISRTRREAQENLDRLWLLRSWTMPQFGKSTLSGSNRAAHEALADEARFRRQGNNQDPAGGGAETNRERDARLQRLRAQSGTEKRGEPPAVLLLSAYSLDSAYGGTEAHNINRVPVVITNISIPYTSDVDYIPTERSQVPMPSIMVIDMTLQETHSPREYENFSLSAFKQGTLPGF